MSRAVAHAAAGVPGLATMRVTQAAQPWPGTLFPVTHVPWPPTLMMEPEIITRSGAITETPASAAPGRRRGRR